MGFAFHPRGGVLHRVPMKKRWVVNLTVEERDGLEQLVSRERGSGLKRQRANILLRADDGLTDEEIVAELAGGIITGERGRRRCCERYPLTALRGDLSRSGVPDVVCEG